MAVIGKYVLGNSEVKKYSVDYSGWLGTGELIVGVAFDVGLTTTPALTITDSVIDDTGSIVTFYAQGGDGKNVIPVGVNITTSFAQIKTDTINFASQVALGPGAPAGTLIVPSVVVGIFGTPTSGQLAAWSSSNVLTSGNLSGEITTAGLVSTINKGIAPVWTGLHTFGDGLSVLPGGTIRGLNVAHSSGATTVVGSQGFPFFYQASPTYVFNQITAIDQVNVTSVINHGMSAVLGIGMETGGSNSQGTKVCLELQLVCDIAGANPTYGRDRACLSCDAFDSVGDGGTADDVAHVKGTLFAAGFQVIAAPGALHLQVVSGLEFDVGIQTGASSYARLGTSVVGTGDLPAFSLYDCAYEISSMNTAGAWKTGIMFSSLHGAWGIQPTGTLIGTDNIPSVALNGIDMSYVDLNGGFFLKSNYAHGGTPGVPLFSVDSTGAVVAQRANFGAVVIAGQLQALGSGASLVFQDRTGSTQWQWYVTSNIARLYNGTSDVLSISSAGLLSSLGNNSSAITADGAQVVVQNSSLTQATMFNPITGGVVYDGVRSVVNIPASSTILSANGYGAYIRSRAGTGSSSGGGVLFYGLATAGASSTSVWGANYRFQDSEDISGHSYTGVQLIGSEIDYLVSSAGTTIEGHSMIYASTVSFAGGAGFQITNSTPAFGKLNFGFVSGDAAATCALLVGAVAASGTSINSQTIKLNRFDSSGTEHADLLFSDPAGTMTWQGGGLALQGLAGANCITSYWINGAQKWQIGSLANAHFYAFDQVAGAFVWQMTTGGTFTFTPTVTVPSLLVGANQVVGARATGWTVATGTPSRATFTTSGVTLATLAGVVMALEQDLIAHGLIGT